MKVIGQYLKGDRVIWAVVFLLSVISVLAVYSSTGTLAYKYQGGNTLYYFTKHLLIVAMGIGIMYVVHNVKYTYFSKISVALIVLAAILLPLTLILGTSRNEASRWLTLPIINLSFQTSDLAK
ncbi:MAG: cell division protein FtsW, partial [Bacteroidia bacterium]